jgi:MFS superfamily sulfate permease-like transporter
MIKLKIGLLGFVQILLIVLQLCNVITWSWWCIFIPAYVYVIMYIIGLFVVNKLQSAIVRAMLKKGGVDNISEIPTKNGASKWQQKLEQMQKMQEERTKNKKSVITNY